jgi:hypothetical protein
VLASAAQSRFATVLLTVFLHVPLLAADVPASPAVTSDDEEEAPLDLEFIRQRAEAGKPKAQMQLADFCLVSGDATNAVLWYRKAAAQDEVGAQLALASCLITGRGAARDNQEAARWLQRAAALIGGSNAAPAIAASPMAATNRSPAATAAVRSAPAVGVVASAVTAGGQAAAPMVSTRVPRAAGLQTNAPVLQALPASLRSYSDPR